MIKKNKWDLGLLYKSVDDPAIEKDVKKIESVIEGFRLKYEARQDEIINNKDVLLQAILDHEADITETIKCRPLRYFYSIQDIDAADKTAASMIPLLENRITQAENKVMFFPICLGKIPSKIQKEILLDPRFAHYKVYLQRRFEDAKYNLSTAEEKIVALKSQPAYDMWVTANSKILNTKTVVWQKKNIPLSKALNMVSEQKNSKDRSKLTASIYEVLKSVAPFSEAEINAIATNKKINDELRGYKSPEENTIRRYRNDPKVVRTLVDTVVSNNSVAHRFYVLKAKLLKQKTLNYCDRNAKIGTIKRKFTLEDSSRYAKEAFGKLNPLFSETVQSYLDNGQVDAYPKVGKHSGAYCSGSYIEPTFILLNHNDSLRTYSTFAHEFGHAIHTLLSRKQGVLYFGYSTSLAETASTLFEAIAMESIYDQLSDKEKIILLHDKINDDISTIFRQIACYNLEMDIHRLVRSKGFISKEEIAEVHNRNMASYLGPKFKMKTDDGYMFVQWHHIRNFFYVYTYAYGLLVSKALLRKYKKDPKFWQEIEKFLSAGKNESPENILRSIGIDVNQPSFWKEGIMEIEEDIKKLEKLTGF